MLSHIRRVIEHSPNSFERTTESPITLNRMCPDKSVVRRTCSSSDTFTVLTPTAFSLKNNGGFFNYHYCEQVALPERSRGAFKRKPGVDDVAFGVAANIEKILSTKIKQTFNLNSCASPTGISINAELPAQFRWIFLDDKKLEKSLSYLWMNLKKSCDEYVRVHGIPSNVTLRNRDHINLLH